MPLEDVDARMRAHLFGQRGLDGRSGRVGHMHDAPVAVAAFAREVVAERTVFVAREGNATRDQPFDRLATVLDHETRGVGSQSPAPAVRVSLMWCSIESALSSTAAMPPCAQLEAESSTCFLVISATCVLLRQASAQVPDRQVRFPAPARRMSARK
jgi:hypothetical protein